MKKLGLTATSALVLVIALLVGAQALTAGSKKSRVKAEDLSGYNESPGVSSQATGSFRAKIDDDEQKITYEFTYGGLQSAATVAHIHFGNRFTNGGVVVFFCGGGSKPDPCPAGTDTVATLEGTFTPADLTPNAQAVGQGIAGSSDWEEFVDAIRAGKTYANVHNAPFPGGEARAQINDRGHGDDD
jgi:CHRD domain